MTDFVALAVLPFVVVALVLRASVRILPEHQRVALLTLGRFDRVLGPGLVLLLPGVQTALPFDLRVLVSEVEETVATRYGGPSTIRLRVFWKVSDPRAAASRPVPASQESVGQAVIEAARHAVRAFANEERSEPGGSWATGYVRDSIQEAVRPLGVTITEVEVSESAARNAAPRLIVEPAPAEQKRGGA